MLKINEIPYVVFAVLGKMELQPDGGFYAPAEGGAFATKAEAWACCKSAQAKGALSISVTFSDEVLWSYKAPKAA